MRFLVVCVFSISLLLWGCKGSQEGHSHDGGKESAQPVSADGTGTFGTKITPDGAIPVTELVAKMNGQKSVEGIKIEAPITASCQAKGCWMDVKNGESDMKVTFKDYGFFVPKNCAGKTAVMEGKAFINVTSVEELVHYAVDGGMSEEEAKKKFTAPKEELRFEATGVVIK
ncbi:MAG: DUF4920 domain-containing protein [Bacteroidia bacterium]|nr:DUF4920 domain-containing protein [Bacteroidia bacterium]